MRDALTAQLRVVSRENPDNTKERARLQRQLADNEAARGLAVFDARKFGPAGGLEGVVWPGKPDDEIL